MRARGGLGNEGLFAEDVPGRSLSGRKKGCMSVKFPCDQGPKAESMVLALPVCYTSETGPWPLRPWPRAAHSAGCDELDLDDGRPAPKMLLLAALGGEHAQGKGRRGVGHDRTQSEGEKQEGGGSRAE